ncbi:MAG: DUF4442 domain-containing protein [Caulobacteraceae bacterium]|nr:DUF4442 domain-containing protein [Caulobacteraceae bacterium]
MAPEPDLIAAVQARLIAHLPFAGLLGLTVTRLSPTSATVRLPWRDDLCNHLGGHHAGAIFTAGETAGAALLSLISLSNGGRAVVMDAVIRFITSSKAELYATASFGGQSAGERIPGVDGADAYLPIRVRLQDDAGREIAELTMTGRISPMRADG